ncbi:hypothetical protein HPG69_003669 [Diceros bicornis minor]|uniref:Serpin domain-containing protein n=1 Tax=Diceros bicornis minor TaxID=77932 RepID=A0A7J7ETW5_DICBM|nr:hypothetical protein HPG69_003669 [Diceros bicornis minor]
MPENARMLSLNPLYLRRSSKSSPSWILLSEGNGTFALNLLKKLAENNSKKIFFSPMSILSSLAMVLLGVKGNTAAQISQITLLVSQGVYEAKMKELGFVNAAEKSTKRINAWVANKTKEVLSPDSVESLPMLILVNAIYFKGKWNSQFKKELTMEIPFKIRKVNILHYQRKSLGTVPNEKKPVQMMFNIYTFKTTYIGEIFTQILVLPDVGKELNMIIVLPDENTNLEMVEKELSYEKFIEWTRPGKMYEDELEVFLPRFKLEESYDMEDVLCSLGMTNAFEEERADFLGMSSKKGLYLSRIIHKSFVEVSEEGTEAAAVTAIIMVPT